jgi:hypothetical protein
LFNDEEIFGNIHGFGSGFEGLADVDGSSFFEEGFFSLLSAYLCFFFLNLKINVSFK